MKQTNCSESFLDQIKRFKELVSLAWAFEVLGDHLKHNLMCIIQDKIHLIPGTELKMSLIEKAESRTSGSAPFAYHSIPLISSYLYYLLSGHGNAFPWQIKTKPNMLAFSTNFFSFC